MKSPPEKVRFKDKMFVVYLVIGSFATLKVRKCEIGVTVPVVKNLMIRLEDLDGGRKDGDRLPVAGIKVLVFGEEGFIRAFFQPIEETMVDNRGKEVRNVWSAIF